MLLSISLDTALVSANTMHLYSWHLGNPVLLGFLTPLFKVLFHNNF